MGFRVWDLVLRVLGVVYEAQNIHRCRVQSAGFRAQGSGFRGYDAGFRVQGTASMVQDSGCTV